MRGAAFEAAPALASLPAMSTICDVTDRDTFIKWLESPDAIQCLYVGATIREYLASLMALDNGKGKANIEDRIRAHAQRERAFKIDLVKAIDRVRISLDAAEAWSGAHSTDSGRRKEYSRWKLLLQHLDAMPQEYRQTDAREHLKARVSDVFSDYI